MTTHVDSNNSEKLKKYYEDGYAIGRLDALTGIPFKLIRHTLHLRSPYMREWERGYIDGYYSVNGTKTASSEDS